ncbi:MAG: DUF1566 domain-containing protein [Bacteroidales bacterium]
MKYYKLIAFLLILTGSVSFTRGELISSFLSGDLIANLAGSNINLGLTDKGNLLALSKVNLLVKAEGMTELSQGGADNVAIGDEYMDGIVFHTYIGSDGKQHGLVVSTKETTAQWQSQVSLVNAKKRNLGALNTNLMVNSPAKDWVRSLGPDWYLPSIDELGALYRNMSVVNKSLRAKGYPILMASFYWSSTEYDKDNANNIDFMDGTAYYYSKTKAYRVRAIKAF